MPTIVHGGGNSGLSADNFSRTLGGLNESVSTTTVRTASIPVTSGSTYVLTFNILYPNATYTDSAIYTNLSGLTILSSQTNTRQGTSEDGYIATSTVVGIATGSTISFRYRARINTYSLVRIDV